MLPSTEVWLIVMLLVNGSPTETLEYTRYSSVDACIQRSTDLLKRAVNVRPDKGWEISVDCHILKPPEEES